MPNIAITTSSFGSSSEDALALLDSIASPLRLNPFGRKLTREESVENLRDAVGLVAGLEPLDRAVLESCKGTLKAIARVGIGMDNVDQEAAAEFGIKVSNTPEAPTAAVAELTLTSLLALLRGLPQTSATLHRGEWKKTVGRGLANTRVLIVGCGRIGRGVGNLVASLGANVRGSDQYLSNGDWNESWDLVDLEDGLDWAEAVCVHAAGCDPILGKDEFARLRDGALILAAGRGGQVDETALVAALDSGKVAGAWLDVFAEEPYSGPLQGRDNVLLTPHACTYTAQCRASMELHAAKNLIRDLGIELS